MKKIWQVICVLGLLLVFSACKNTTIEVQSNAISEERISEVVTASENTETSEEDVVEVAEESPYKHIPEELLDENGIYHPEEVTADMLRERFADVDRFLSERGYVEDFGKEIKSFIMRANYSYITDATFQEIMKENNLEIIPGDFRNNLFEFELDYEHLGDDMVTVVETGTYEPDYPIENYFFDPYIQYTARVIYDLEYKKWHAWQDGESDKYDEYDFQGKQLFAEKSEDLPIHMDGSNLYDKTDFWIPIAMAELFEYFGENHFGSRAGGPPYYMRKNMNGDSWTFYYYGFWGRVDRGENVLK